jgi:hypothetical protein
VAEAPLGTDGHSFQEQLPKPPANRAISELNAEAASHISGGLTQVLRLVEAIRALRGLEKHDG